MMHLLLWTDKITRIGKLLLIGAFVHAVNLRTDGNRLPFERDKTMILAMESIIAEQLSGYFLICRNDLRVGVNRNQLFLSFFVQELNEHLNFKLSPHFGILAPQTRFFRARPGGIQKIPHKAHGNFWKDERDARFRVEELRVIGGSFTHDGARYTLESLEDMISRYQQRKFKKFSVDSNMVDYSTDFLVMYQLSNIRDSNHLMDWNRRNVTSSCFSDQLANRAFELAPMISTRERRGISSGKTTCTLALVGDFKFFQHMGENTAAAINTMVEFITYVDRNFRETKFGSYSDIGLSVQDVILYEDPSSDPYFKSTTWDVGKLLEELSKRPESPLDWSTVCLVHLFTYQAFSNKILITIVMLDFDKGVQGLAWVANSHNGGICDGFTKNRGTYLNTGLTTGINWGNNLMKLTWELTVQHEIGHNFGSLHDPNTAECAPQGNRFVMFATAVDGSSTNNPLFSPCSRSSILNALQSRASCFIPTPTNICGNYILEPEGQDGEEGTSDDEECDEGFTGGPCCTSSCKLRENSQCSDQNFECCTDCNPDPSKLCFKAFPLDARCRADTYCTAQSFSCPSPLNQKPEGSECINHGTCISHSAPQQRCLPFCASFGASECRCTEESEDECSLCCVNDQSVSTLFCPDQFFWNISASICQHNSNYTWIQPGLRPFGDTCEAVYKVLSGAQYEHLRTPKNLSLSKEALSLTAGSVCSGGSCSADGKCVTPSDDFTSRVFEFFASLTLDMIKVWILRNLIPTIVVFGSLVWLISSLIVARKDRKRLRQLLDEQSLLNEHRITYIRQRESKVLRARSAFKMKESRHGETYHSRVAPAPDYEPHSPRSAWVVSSDFPESHA